MGIRDWIPNKFKRRPWISIAVVVGAITALVAVVVIALGYIADVFGVEWLKGRADIWLDNR